MEQKYWALNCMKKATDGCQTNALGHVMFSFNHQDYYLYSKYCKYLCRTGVYVELASSNAKWMSNTSFYSVYWLARPLYGGKWFIYFEPINQDRSCQLVPTCAGHEDGINIAFNIYVVKGENNRRRLQIQTWSQYEELEKEDKIRTMYGKEDTNLSAWASHDRLFQFRYWRSRTRSYPRVRLSYYDYQWYDSRKRPPNLTNRIVRNGKGLCQRFCQLDTVEKI